MITSNQVRTEARRFFHGGAPGLGVGDLIEPHEPNFLDDCPICQKVKAGEATLYDRPTGRPDRVYVTTDREYARFYASKYPRGDLYVVDPVGELVESDEDPFPTWLAPTARVRGVYDRCVALTGGQRRALLKRWLAVDLAAGDWTALLGGAQWL